MKTIPPNLDGHGFRIGIVQSRFNESIVLKMLKACEKELLAHGMVAADIDHISVPGALEIPLALQAMAMTRNYHALIAIGAVVRGDTYHFEVVSNESCRGVMDVALETGVPVANGILTTNTEAQAEARVVEKGADCARAAVEMAHAVANLARLKESR